MKPKTTMRAKVPEIVEFMTTLPDEAETERRLISERWLGETMEMPALSLSTGVNIVELDRLEVRLYKMLVQWLGSVPHPVYTREITEVVLWEQAELVRRGAITHAEAARTMKCGTRKARMLLGRYTKMLHGRMSHGVRGLIDHGCTCEICRRAFAEAQSHYAAGGDARTEISAVDLAPCQESSRVYFLAGHRDTSEVLAYCARLGVPADRAFHAWWNKQRTRLSWSLTKSRKQKPVTVVAKTYPDIRGRGGEEERLLRRLNRNGVEESVVAAVLMPGEEVELSDAGWCDAEGCPTPAKRATHIGFEWARMARR